MDRIREGIQRGVVDNVAVSEQVCEKHGTAMVKLKKPQQVRGEESPRDIDHFCIECVQEEMEIQERQILEKHLNADVYVKTYNVLERDSIIPKELSEASFDTFQVRTDQERALKEFAENQARKYLKGMEGNTLITGGTGIGKSHLSLAMARAINDGYKEQGKPVSVLFVSLTDIIARVQDGWNYGKGGASLAMQEAVEMLVSPDYGHL